MTNLLPASDNKSLLGSTDQGGGAEKAKAQDKSKLRSVLDKLQTFAKYALPVSTLLAAGPISYFGVWELVAGSLSFAGAVPGWIVVPVTAFMALASVLALVVLIDTIAGHWSKPTAAVA